MTLSAGVQTLVRRFLFSRPISSLALLRPFREVK